MFKKRKVATPGFGHTPYNPIQGEQANLRQDGTFPFCAMMQVAAEDTYENYVICRGFDTRLLRFIDYASGDSNRPGISVAKPFGKRTIGAYEIGEIYPAMLPTQGNAAFSDFRHVTHIPPSPVSVDWRVGQNPGVVTGGGLDGGQPADLTDAIEVLYDHNGKVINWLLIDNAGSSGATLDFSRATTQQYSGSTTPVWTIAQGSQLSLSGSDLQVVTNTWVTIELAWWYDDTLPDGSRIDYNILWSGTSSLPALLLGLNAMTYNTITPRTFGSTMAYAQHDQISFVNDGATMTIAIPTVVCQLIYSGGSQAALGNLIEKRWRVTAFKIA